MNGALISLLSRFLSDGDAKKAKEDDRKYREEQKAKDWEREDTKVAEDRAYRQSLVKADELKKLKQTTLDNTWLEQHYPKSAADVNANTLELVPDVSKKLLEEDRLTRKALATINPIYQAISDQFPGWSQETVLAAIGNNPELSNIAQNITAFKGINAGVPDSTVRATLAGNDASIARAKLDKIIDEAKFDRAPQEAVGKQRESILRSILGGSNPSEAYAKQFYPRVNLETGETTIQENPYYSRMTPDPLAGMVGGNNMLKGIADQLGLPKYPMQIGPDGVPVQRTKPATATPVKTDVQRNAIFGGNLAVSPDEVINYGKITPEEAVKMQGLIVNKDGTVSAPRKEREPFAFSKRDAGFSGLINLANPNSPYNLVNRIYGSEGLGIGDAYVTGTRELTEEEKEAARQKTRKALNKIY